jgi:hypothetical protein
VLKRVQEILAENRLLLVPLEGHMIDCAGVFDAKLTAMEGL